MCTRARARRIWNKTLLLAVCICSWLYDLQVSSPWLGASDHSHSIQAMAPRRFSVDSVFVSDMITTLRRQESARLSRMCVGALL